MCVHIIIITATMILNKQQMIFFIVTVILTVKVEQYAAQWRNVNPIDAYSFRPTYRMMRDTFFNLIGQSGNDQEMFEKNLRQGVMRS